MDQEFGAFPIAVEVYLGGYDGPVWEIAPFRYRSGWLMASEVRMVMPFGRWQQTLIAAIRDHGEVYAPHVAGRLFEMPVSLPKCAECDPPEELGEIMDGLYWDFLGRMDRENLRVLQEEEEHTDHKIRALECRCAAAEAELWAAIRALRAEKRSANVSTERRAQIDEKLVLLLDVPEQIARVLRARMAAIRQEMDELREAVLSAQTEECEIETLFTVHWTARSGRRGMTIRLPVFQEETYGAQAWRTREQSDVAHFNLNKQLAAIQFGAWG